MEWRRNSDIPLRAGVNGFGFGGTNVHVVLEEAPEESNYEYEEEKFPYLIQLTGRNQNVVKNVAANLKKYIEQNENLTAGLICQTINNSQKELSTKNAAIVESREHLLKVLTQLENDENTEAVYKGRSNPKRQTEAYLVLDGNIKNVENYKDDLFLRFDIFNVAYKECMDICKNFKNLNSEEMVDFEAFADQYALGVLFSS